MLGRTTNRLSVLLMTATLLLVGAAPLAATAGGPTTHVVSPGESIQAAVDAAAPGDTILVEAGVYHEAVQVFTPDLTITGEGVNVTVLDGQEDIRRDGILVMADGVSVQDLTVRDFQGNGVFYDGVTGFYVDRVAALSNGPYGIYAIRSEVGHVRDSYASGHADSGFYIGEVFNCQCVLEGLKAAGNLIGYSGTGAGGVVIQDSIWQNNAAGIVPNVLPNEPVPQQNLTVVNNLVRDNNNEAASRQWHFGGGVHVPSGLGIVIAGGIDNLVEDNIVTGHDRGGVAVAWLFTEPSLNVVRNNHMAGNQVDIIWDGGGVNNCFEGNGDGQGPATFDAGVVWNTAGFLPDCDTPNAGPPDAGQMARLVSLLVFNCEPGQQPFHEDCHQHIS